MHVAANTYTVYITHIRVWKVCWKPNTLFHTYFLKSLAFIAYVQWYRITTYKLEGKKMILYEMMRSSIKCVLTHVSLISVVVLFNRGRRHGQSVQVTIYNVHWWTKGKIVESERNIKAVGECLLQVCSWTNINQSSWTFEHTLLWALFSFLFVFHKDTSV